MNAESVEQRWQVRNEPSRETVAFWNLSKLSRESSL